MASPYDALLEPPQKKATSPYDELLSEPSEYDSLLSEPEVAPTQSPAPSFTATMPVKVGQPIGTPQDFTTFDPNALLTAPDSRAPSQSVNTGDYNISYAKAAPTNAVPVLGPVNGEWTPEAIAAQNARADELNPPTESALRERSYNEALVPFFQESQGPRKLTEAELLASQTPRVEAFEPKTFTGEIKKGDIPGAIGVAYKAARESLEPFFGPTEEQFNNEKVPWGTNPDGSVKYEYKPLGSRLDKTGLLMTPLLETKMMEPKPGDTSLDAAGKATFNFMAGLVNFGLSGLGIATVGLGAATGATTRAAGFAPAGLGAEGSVAAQTAARLAATARVVSGGFAIDMASAVPEQYKAATESPTLQGRIEGWLGTVSSLGFAALAAKHAAKKPLERAEGQILESVVELAKRTPDAVLEAVARNMEADVYSRNLAKAELQRRQIEQQAALAPEAAAAAESAGTAMPSGTAGPPAKPNAYDGIDSQAIQDALDGKNGTIPNPTDRAAAITELERRQAKDTAAKTAEPPDPAATAVGVIKTAAAADAAGKPLDVSENPLQKIVRETKEKFAAVKAAIQPLFPSIEIVEAPTGVDIRISLDGTKLEVSPTLLEDIKRMYPGREAEALKLAAEEELAHHRHIKLLGSGFKEKLAGIWNVATKEMRELVKSIYGNRNLTPDEWGAELLRMGEQAKRTGILTESIHPKRGEAARNGISALKEWAEKQEGDAAAAIGKAELAALAPVATPAAAVPKLREGQKQGDLLGGSEDLTLVGERVRSEAPKPKGPEPTVQQTISDALDAYGDLPSAWEHLDNQVKSLENNKANKAAITRLNAAKRKIENTLEEEARRAEVEQVNAFNTGLYELESSIKELGGIATTTGKGKGSGGELSRIAEARKGALLKLFRKNAPSHDTLRKGLEERGFQFATPDEMFMALEDSMRSGKKLYGSQFPEGYTGGPGAMGPVEAAYQAASRRILGGYNAEVEAAQIRRGQVPTVSEARKEDPVTFESAMDAIEKNPALPEKLVDDILKKEKKSITDEEQQMLTYRRAELENKMAAESERAIDPSLTPEQQAVHQTNAEVLEAQLLRAEEANRMAGTASGRALRSRQMKMNDDYTYAGLMMRERRATGDVVPKERAEELKKTAEEYKKAQAEVDLERETRQKRDEDAVMEAVMVEMERELEAAAKTGDTYHPSVMQHAKEIVERAKGEAADAWKRIRSQMGSESGAVGGVGGPKGEGKKLGQPTKQQIAAKNRATLINDVALILKARVYEFGVKMAEAAQYVLLKSGDMGDSIRPILARAVAKANTMMERELNTRPQKVKEAVKTGATAPEKQPKTKPTPESYIDKGKASVVAGDDPLYRREIGEAVDGGNVTVETHKLMSSARKLVYDIVVAHWENGVRGTDALMDAALKTVQEFLPDATLRDVHRAYGEYGKVKFPNKDALSMQLSAAYRETKLMEDIARMEKDDKDALRRGFTPAKPNLRQRELASKRAELQKLRQGEPSPEKLAGIQQARQTALENRMEVLDKMLKTGEKPPKGRKVSDDVFTEQLKSEKQAMQDLWNEIEAAKNPPPPEHIAELTRLQDRADILRDRLARMELTQPKAEGKPTVDTAEIAAAKAEIKQLSDTMAELRKPVPLSDAQKALDSALVARERAGQTLDDISTGKVKDPAKIKEALTQLEEDVRLETDALKALAAEMRRDAKPKGDPGYLKEQSQIKALERAIASYAEKVSKGDLAGKGNVQGPDSRRVAQLKAIRDSRRSAYQAARDAGKPVLSPEQRWNATRLKALTKREADFAEKIRTGQYARPPKRVPPKMDQATQDAQIRMDAIKQKFLKEQFDYYQKQRALGKKITDGIGQTLRAGINSVSSTDLSGFRQGMGATMIAFGKTVFPVDVRRGVSGKTEVVLTNPLKSAMMILRPAAKMIVAGISEQKARRMEKARENRPNAKSGAYDEMAIDQTTLDTKVHSKHEEIMYSVLDEWAQLPMRTGSTGKTIITAPGKVAAKVVHASNRAFNTLLNEMRLDLADALLAENFKDRAPTSAELKVLGNLVNIATGRGNINPTLARGAGFVFWAPSFFASRLKGLTFEPVWGAKQPWKGTGRARAAVAKDYARVIISGYLLWKVGQMFSDDDVDTTNSTSSDFRKIVRGNTRIDPWGGHQQVAVFAARAITGKTTSITGNERENNLGDVIANFGRNKLRPDWGALWNAYEIYHDKQRPGRPQTYSEVVASMYTPMSLRDIAEVMRDRGMAEGAIVEALAMFGAGVSVYGDEEKTKGSR